MIPRYTVQEAADLSKRHPETIRRACQSGELKANQRIKGGNWIIREDDLEAWLDGTSNVVPIRSVRRAS